MKRDNFFLLMLFLIFMTVGLVSIIHDAYYTLDVSEIEIDMAVGDRVGINLDTDKLWFGTLKPGSTAIRSIDIKNDYEFPITVKLSVEGELEERIRISKSFINLEPGQTTKVEISANVPVKKKYGNYTSKLVIISRKGD